MPGKPNLQILYQDQNLILVNKPSGLRTIPDGYHPELPCLVNELSMEFGKVFVVHRLDKDTSGVILFALSPEFHKALNQQFSSRLVKKVYHALVVGTPDWENITADFPLLVNGDRSHRTVINSSHGKPAKTEFTILQSFGEYSLVQAIPQSGYTHQIRAHACALGIPILSDPLYWSKTILRCRQLRSDIIPRLALHAHEITFIHPETQAKVTITAPYPQDFEDGLTHLTRQLIQNRSLSAPVFIYKHQLVFDRDIFHGAFTCRYRPDDCCQ